MNARGRQGRPLSDAQPLRGPPVLYAQPAADRRRAKAADDRMVRSRSTPLRAGLRRQDGGGSAMGLPRAASTCRRRQPRRREPVSFTTLRRAGRWLRPSARSSSKRGKTRLRGIVLGHRATRCPGQRERREYEDRGGRRASSRPAGRRPRLDGLASACCSKKCSSSMPPALYMQRDQGRTPRRISCRSMARPSSR